MTNNQYMEEILQLIETISESAQVKIEDLKKYLGDTEIDDILKQLIEAETILIDSTNNISLTIKGKKEANEIIRRHRLAERLLFDVLDIKNEEKAEKQACDFEHILDKEVTDNICTLLGHPKFCPDGKPIPPGECCSQGRKHISRIVSPLSALSVGEKGKIAYMLSGEHQRLDRLFSMGLLPGTTVRIHQKTPSLVICFEETTLAMDDEIAHDIFVRKI